MQLTNRPDAMEQSGVSYRQFFYWIQRGFIKPEKRGQGKRDEYLLSGTQLRKLKHMVVLTNLGIEPISASVYADHAKLVEDGYYIYEKDHFIVGWKI